RSSLLEREARLSHPQGITCCAHPTCLMLPRRTILRCSRPMARGFCSSTPASNRWKAIGCRRRGTEATRSEEHTSELQSRGHLVCRLLLEKKKTKIRSSASRKRV